MEILTWGHKEKQSYKPYFSVLSKVISDGIFNERFKNKIKNVGKIKKTLKT